MSNVLNQVNIDGVLYDLQDNRIVTINGEVEISKKLSQSQFNEILPALNSTQGSFVYVPFLDTMFSLVDSSNDYNWDRIWVSSKYKLSASYDGKAVIDKIGGKFNISIDDYNQIYTDTKNLSSKDSWVNSDTAKKIGENLVDGFVKKCNFDYFTVSKNSTSNALIEQISLYTFSNQGVETSTSTQWIQFTTTAINDNFNRDIYVGYQGNDIQGMRIFDKADDNVKIGKGYMEIELDPQASKKYVYDELTQTLTFNNIEATSNVKHFPKALILKSDDEFTVSIESWAAKYLNYSNDGYTYRKFIGKKAYSDYNKDFKQQVIFIKAVDKAASFENCFFDITPKTAMIDLLGDLSGMIEELELNRANQFSDFFAGQSIVDASRLKLHVNLTTQCYLSLFENCTFLTKPPKLPATTLADVCYGNMFYGCTSLTEAPDLPALSLKQGCYSGMFSGCTALIKAPDLPATILPEGCYSSMFYGCTSLVRLPKFLGTNFAKRCCYAMFENCTSLTTCPEYISGGYFGQECFREMFQNTAVTVPTRFVDCTSIKSSDACQFMFKNCAGICWGPGFSTDVKYELISPKEKVKMDATQTSTKGSAYPFDNMFNGTTDWIESATLWKDGTPRWENTYYLKSKCYKNNKPKGLKFSSPYPFEISLVDSIDISYRDRKGFHGDHSKIMASGNGCDYIDLLQTDDYTIPSQLCDGEYCIWMYGVGGTYFAQSTSVFTNIYAKGRDIKISGKILDLLDLNNPTSLAPYAFADIFYWVTAYTNIDEVILPNFTSDHCYYCAFSCTGITSIPANFLPATELAPYCYSNLFWFTPLKDVSINLLAHVTSISEHSCEFLFQDTYVTKPCLLPVETLAEKCYYKMYDKTKIVWGADGDGTPYRIPSGTVTGTDATDALLSMFSNTTLTGSTMPTTGTPVINTTYYYKE